MNREYTLRGYTVRAALWAVAFLLPVIGGAVAAVGHGPYLAVPVLAAYDGIGPRRTLLWTGLTAVYEFLFHIPPGTLVIPLIILAVGSAPVRHFLRLEPLASAPGWGISALFRAVAVAALWALGMVILSAEFLSLTRSGPPLSARFLMLAWWPGAIIMLAAGVTAGLAVLHRADVPFRRRITFGP